MRGSALAATIRHRIGAQRTHGAAPADGLVVAFMVTSFILTALAAVVLGQTVAGHRAPAPMPRVRFLIGSAALDVPAEWLRPAMPRAGGRVDRLDLALPWPDRDGAPGAARPASERDLAIDGVVLVSLVRADGDEPGPEPTGSLYARFLTPDVWPNPGGLILRRFKAGTPYEGDELYLSPPDGRIFAARCPRAQANATVREGCAGRLRIGGFAVDLRFAAARLARWELLTEGVRRAIEGMGRAAG